MKTIYKYQLETTDFQSITLPKGYEILTVQTQNQTPCLWVLHDKKPEKFEDVEINIIGTGHAIYHVDGKTERKYIGTYQLHGGQLIFHVFQRIK